MKTFEESLAEFMQDPEFRAEWEALEPEREIIRAIIEGKPLTSFTPEQIAEAADVSLEEARIMQRGKQARVMWSGKQQAHAAVH